ncbi:TetR/AcrR family transcriptional regulator [Nocardia ignorata]|uniref:TetR family transcriptional regulator n=1 Tax=Nocardia ignorata TaxID=145285 RepID=A0A4R6P4G5_NOCIG|nr:TetR/AcrR family transcriptional regulator [Nocardia ignorata]TDP31900.1 TetR family transcriptional regulator [Nocardia ignorata]
MTKSDRTTTGDRTATRDKERTRRAILDAAEAVFTERGANVALADIAVAAGVTKSGLMHHFPHREALVNGVAEHILTRLHEEVRAQIDLSENRPGKFTRAYIRAFTGDSEYVKRVLAPTSLITTLGTSPEREALYERDARILADAFAADGLPHTRVLLIRYATEGLAVAAASPYLSDEDLETARAELLAMTEVE